VKRILISALLLFMSCAAVKTTENEVTIHIRQGGSQCSTSICGITAQNLSKEECMLFNDFEFEFFGALTSQTKITGIQAQTACTRLRNWNVVVVDADNHGSWQLGKTWVDGATTCKSRLIFVGLPAGYILSALPHEMFHALECVLETPVSDDKHFAWKEKGYCDVISKMSMRPDGCSKD